MPLVYIGLGSNLGDRNNNLLLARKQIAALPATTVFKESSIIETAPVDLLQQPDFFNQIISITTELSPEQLLENLLRIENSLGRIRKIEKGPRIIDLDILLYDSIQLNTEKLIIPHPEIKNR